MWINFLNNSFTLHWLVRELQISGITKASTKLCSFKPDSFKLTTSTFFNSASVLPNTLITIRSVQITCKFNCYFKLSVIYERWAPLSNNINDFWEFFKSVSDILAYAVWSNTWFKLLVKFIGVDWLLCWLDEVCDKEVDEWWATWVDEFRLAWPDAFWVEWLGTFWAEWLDVFENEWFDEFWDGWSIVS